MSDHHDYEIPPLPPRIHFKDTQWGFEYGTAKIERIHSEKNGQVHLSIATPLNAQRLQIKITKTGRVRVWKGDKELK